MVPFAFPFDRDPDSLSRELAKMAARFGTTVAEGERWKELSLIHI